MTMNRIIERLRAVADNPNARAADRRKARAALAAHTGGTAELAELERRVGALEAAAPYEDDDEDGDLDAAIAKLRKVLDDPDATDDEKERARRGLAALDDEDADDEEANALAYSRGKTRHHPAMSAHDRAIANFKKRYGYR